MTRYRRGYTAPAELRDAIRAAHRPDAVRSIAVASFDHLSIIAAATVPTVLAATAAWPWVVVAAAVGVVVVARQTRALENLVHEASHYNWIGGRRAMNDVAAVVLAAVPAGVRIGAYRTEHLSHHGKFGTALDPDRNRYEELALESIDRSGVLAFGRDVLRRLGPYRSSWYRSAVADPLTAAVPFGWATVVIVIPQLIVFGWGVALVGTAVWLTGYLVVLPLLRLVAESDEHVYSDASTVFDATITNVGLGARLLLHPHGDGFHTIHHLWPGIPHHRVAAVHRLLVRRDPDGYGRRLRVRTRLLSRPGPVADPVVPGVTASPHA